MAWTAAEKFLSGLERSESIWAKPLEQRLYSIQGASQLLVFHLKDKTRILYIQSVRKVQILVQKHFWRSTVSRIGFVSQLQFQSRVLLQIWTKIAHLTFEIYPVLVNFQKVWYYKFGQNSTKTLNKNCKSNTWYRIPSNTFLHQKWTLLRGPRMLKLTQFERLKYQENYYSEILRNSYDECV